MGLNAHFAIHEPKEHANGKKLAITKKGKHKKTKIKKEDVATLKKDSETLEADSAITLHKVEGETDSKPKSKIKTKRTYPCQVCGKQMISASKLR